MSEYEIEDYNSSTSAPPLASVQPLANIEPYAIAELPAKMEQLPARRQLQTLEQPSALSQKQLNPTYQNAPKAAPRPTQVHYLEI